MVAVSKQQGERLLWGACPTLRASLPHLPLTSVSVSGCAPWGTAGCLGQGSSWGLAAPRTAVLQSLVSDVLFGNRGMCSTA